MTSKFNDLDSLQVFDELVVGSPIVEKDRIFCDYTVISDKEENSFKLIYKYGEDVFRPEDPTYVNYSPGKSHFSVCTIKQTDDLSSR